MFYLNLLALLAFGDNIPTPKTLYYDQVLDHFNANVAQTTFKQRVLYVDEHYDGGPMLFYAGNEAPIESFYYNTGLVFDWAPEFKALVVFPEHRYYGESLPFGNPDSFKPSNMGYLSLEQAIADYVEIIEHFKGLYNVTQPVIAFGGSYGGVLAAALRIHYPATVDMSLAASAPIPQTLNTVDPTLFFKTVTQVFSIHDKSCPDVVRAGFSQLDAIANQPGGLASLGKLFKVCGGLNSTADVAHLKMWATNAFTLMAMANYPYPANFLGSLPAWPMNYSCSEILKANSPIEGLAFVAGLPYNTSASQTCHDIYTEYVSCADQTGCGTGLTANAWDYQECTEVVYEMVMNNQTDMFPPRVWNIGNLTSYCEKYGVKPRDDWMRKWFPLKLGGVTSRIIFSNGLLDPWHLGGYLTDLSDSLPAVVIKDGAHHLDLRGSNPKDPQSVVLARLKEKSILKRWMKEIELERRHAA